LSGKTFFSKENFHMAENVLLRPEQGRGAIQSGGAITVERRTKNRPQ